MYSNWLADRLFKFCKFLFSNVQRMICVFQKHTPCLKMVIMSLAPYSCKCDPILFSLKYSNLNNLNQATKLKQSVKVQGCDIAEIASELPIFLNSNHATIDPNLDCFEFELNPVIAINFLLNKSSLIHHVTSRCTNITNYPYKSIIDFSILPSAILFNCFSSIKLYGIHKKDAKITQYLTIHIELELDISLFTPMNNKVHLNIPDISKYQLSTSYSKSLFLQQIKAYPLYKSNPVKRSAPLDPIIKTCNSLPLNIPFYLRYYYNAMESDILQLYQSNINELYTVSDTIVNYIIQYCKSWLHKSPFPSHPNLDMQSQLESVFNHLKSNLPGYKAINITVLSSNIKQPLQSLLIELLDFNENQHISTSHYNFIIHFIHFINHFIPIQTRILNCPLSLLAYQCFNLLITNKSIPIDLPRQFTLCNTNTLYKNDTSEVLSDFKLATILYNINHSLPFQSNYSCTLYCQLIHLNISQQDASLIQPFLFLLALPMMHTNDTTLNILDKLLPIMPIKYHYILFKFTKFDACYSLQFYQLMRKYSIHLFVIKIQSFYRKHSMKQVPLLSMIKGYFIRQHVCRLKTMIIGLQSCIRGVLMRDNKQATLHAIISIQSCSRRLFVKQHVLCMKQWILQLQSLCRRRIAIHFKQQTICLFIHVQSRIRGRVAIHNYKHIKHCIIGIQACCRALLLKENQRHILSTITCIQACIRCKIVQQHFKQQTTAFIQFQSHCKRNIVQHQVKCLNLSVLQIQSCFRKHVAVRYKQHIISSIIAFQSCCRMQITMLSYKNTFMHIILLQSLIRGHLMRIAVKHDLITNAIILLQSRIRGVCNRHKLVVMQQTSTLVSCMYKSYITRMSFIVLMDSIIRNQKMIRGYLVRYNIQQIQYALYKQQQLKYYAATIIQKWSRGYLVRKQQKNKSHPIKYTLKTNTIGLRSELALNHILNRRYIVELLSACREINVVTALSRDLCCYILQHDALQILLLGIQRTNRSEPHKLYIIEILRILRNVCKHLELLGYFNVAWIETLMELTKKYHKEEVIMGYTIQLIYLLGLNKQHYQVLATEYKTHLQQSLQKMTMKRKGVVLYLSRISRERKYNLIGQDELVLMRRGSRVGLSKRHLQAWFDDVLVFGQTKTILKSLLLKMREGEDDLLTTEKQDVK